MPQPLRRPVLLAVLLLAAVVVSAPAQVLPRLSTTLPGTQAPERLGRGVLRAQRLAVDGEQLRRFPVPGDRLGIDLFDDVRVVAVLDAVTDDRLNGYVWSGRIEGDPYGSAILLLDEGEVIGEVRAGGRRYAIRGDGPGRGVALETDARFEDFGDDAVERPAGHMLAAAGDAPDRVVAGSVIDVLGLFYPRVVSEAGGAKRIKQDFKVAIASFNAALKNAKIDMTARLMAVKKVPYTSEVTDSASGTDVLENLTYADGQMDKALTLREKFGADIVVLAVDDNDAFCGKGWINGNLAGMPASDANWAFNIVTLDCVALLTSLTLAHEAGHNMGLNHDRANSPAGGGAWPYSWGYRVPGAFRTIMAYSCQQFGGLPECPRVTYFSNPKVKYQGEAMGVKASAPDSADAALSLNNVRTVVEAFRPCMKKC